ncbi:MAG: hypothetical protein ACRDQA_09645 [Nocardioidaceae bacterium]
MTVQCATEASATLPARATQRRPAGVVLALVHTGVMGSLDHVRWIGGGTGAGKTAATDRLAQRFGLEVYRSDGTIRDHAGRLSVSRAPLLDSFRRMSMDERWVLRDPATMYQTFPWFHGEGFDLLLQDLRSLPTGRVILAEGFRLLPRLVRPHLRDLRHAVWLIPVPPFRRRAFDVRSADESFWMRTADPQRAFSNLLQRDQMFSEHVAAEAGSNELRTMTMDGSATVDETADALAKRFDLGR